MALNYFRAKPVYIERAIYARLQMLVEEIVVLNELDTSKPLADLTDEFASRILHEYVRQHFEESTKAAAQNFDVKEISFLPRR